MGLSATCLSVSDMERSLAFYSALGFEPRRYAIELIQEER